MITTTMMIATTIRNIFSIALFRHSPPATFMFIVYTVYQYLCIENPLVGGCRAEFT